MLGFIYSHLFSADFQAPAVDLHGKTAIVTGSNVGLGYEGAKHLAQNNVSHLILAVRDNAKGESAAGKIKEEVPSFKGEISVWKLDMASFASVREFGKRIATLERLDILIESAGVFHVEWITTKDGWEDTLQVNVIATGLLAALSLPKLSATADLPGNTFKPHLVIVASEVHAWAKFPQQGAPTLLAALNDKDQAVLNDIYNTSKLLDILMTREIAKLPAARKVNVNSLNPGLCVSELRRDLPWVFAKFLNYIAWTTEKGSRNYLYAATQETKPGAYVSFCKEYEPENIVNTEKGDQLQKKLFDELKQVWIREAPEVEQVLS